jgi:glycosyl transferase family 25
MGLSAGLAVEARPGSGAAKAKGPRDSKGLHLGPSGMATKTSIKVISLAESVERQRAFSADPRSALVPWEFFPALRKPELPLRYDEPLAIAHFGRPLKSGELGAYASHYATWLQFLGSPCDQLIVFEDDVVVDWEIVRLLAATDLASHGIHSLHLFATQPIKYRIARYKFISDHSHLLRVKGLMLGCQAYLLTRKAVQALVRDAAVIDAPVDWVTSRYWRLSVPNYCLYPFPLFERHGKSTIAHAQDLGFVPSAADRFRRLVWRAQCWLQREWADRVSMKDAGWGPVKDEGTALLGDLNNNRAQNATPSLSRRLRGAGAACGPEREPGGTQAAPEGLFDPAPTQGRHPP